MCPRPAVQLGFVSSLHFLPPAASVHSESVIVFVSVCPSPALPAKFTKDLRKEAAMEGSTAKLRCELSKAAPVEWRKGPETLRAGDRVSLRQEGAVCELEIRELTVEDAGEYSCVCGQETTSATLTIKGKDRVWPSRAVLWCPVTDFTASFCIHSMFSPRVNAACFQKTGISFTFLF